MNTWMKATAVVFAVAILSMFAVDHATAQDGVTSLRGDADLNDGRSADEIMQLKTGNRFERSYRQQPPLIPHKVEKYQVDLKANQCIGCHDWPQNVEANAPKISETHYVSPTGVRLNKVSGSRWFCNQCHVPQVDAKELVENTFQSSREIK